ncbi:hypothetical protein M409DRAFT_26936 [Zasmidium cellare ATCC 36951]|uniref:2EXR domain-containing protein n=1 Tax=Zasmidium cellare ATCC 36951 TaxID=1080233 RepID=A0A6A6C8Z1_ZASCE|nr:uncharacterized protein M409DRAFT_26936 [Zasmidium cellare ATCC 36951]KAF2162700.1 hypothetical protein M409DRAFT_26936 [Zasmidium cellare ATCC 36951]
MTHQTSNDNNPKCHLFRLPPEIRNEIYHLVFTPQESICLSPILHCGTHHGAPKRFKVPALLRTSRQIRHEAAGLFYSKTTFICHSSASTFAQCLKIIDKEHLKFFRKIEYRTYENVWSARLWLQVVADLLGERGGCLGTGL